MHSRAPWVSDSGRNDRVPQHVTPLVEPGTAAEPFLNSPFAPPFSALGKLFMLEAEGLFKLHLHSSYFSSPFVLPPWPDWEAAEKSRPLSRCFIPPEHLGPGHSAALHESGSGMSCGYQTELLTPCDSFTPQAGEPGARTCLELQGRPVRSGRVGSGCSAFPGDSFIPYLLQLEA